ncbi:MAG TPA: class I SAM-dependent methyltransferase [Flavobacterium sp.]|jgi:tRNA (cmo5U34)-methyltransferase|uniref:class I SAM-dependent methyltransferase n=1 Tax=Flavobacterium sp. TaxID=239 RepID=UPI001B459B8E|nr:class I SAM-dependent methyltransferase [Flavobacterium sp.]MBP6577694.1 class I SAM-dependent methyltransferase [Chryseobacterium sp.]MBP8888211.1 class I SAM-dependent methyltransferase [Flavobacterium sp.]HRM45120.1 class I SAM-dependent methyltransferase [Flavobacterium sp.]
MKSTLLEIQQRFDNDVERFSNLETGQISTVDATLSLELLTQIAASVCPNAKSVLDLGCGAGNFTLKLLDLIPDLDCTLVDLSLPMLDKAKERISKVSKGKISTVQTDFLNLQLPAETFDIVVTGAAMHHLRTDEEWETVFTKIFKSLKKGGCFWISDLILHDNPAINQLMWKRYADYLEGIGGKAYQKNVFAYIDKEDTPRSVMYQLDLMKKIGFSTVDVLHKNSCFSVFGGIK